MKKIAFVVPWYGDKIPGGAETETRNIVKNLTKKEIEVEILTTCVEKFSSDWNKNYYKEGNYEESGIKIKRFKVRKRDNKKFDNVNALLMQGIRISFEEEQIFFEEMIRSTNLEKYIEENNIPFVEDKTNFEELYLRNKIRLNLFPILKNEYNPRILDAISRLSNIAFDYSTISREYIASKEGLLWEFNKEKILVYIEKLKLQSRSFRNIMYREFFEFISKDPDGINYKIIEEIDNLIFSKTGKYIEIKNVVFKIEYDKLLIYDKNIFENLEMKFYFENLDFSLYSTKFFDIIIEQSSFEEFKNLKQNKDLLFINKKYLDFLKIRNKENGDFLELEFGKKKLKDIFIDEKVSKDIRKNIPIFEIENNIVWVPNIRRSNRYLVDEKDDIIKIRVLSKENLWKD